MIDLITNPVWANNWSMQKREYDNLWVYSSTLLPLVADVIPKRLYKTMRQIPFLRKTVQRFKSLTDKSKK